MMWEYKSKEDLHTESFENVSTISLILNGSIPRLYIISSPYCFKALLFFQIVFFKYNFFYIDTENKLPRPFFIAGTLQTALSKPSAVVYVLQ